LAERILALHEDIFEVYIIEESDGQPTIVDEASKSGISVMGDWMNQPGRGSPLGPIVVLGAAAQIIRDRPTKLITIVYGEEVVVLVPIEERRLVALSTSYDSLFSVTRTVTQQLPRMTREQKSVGIPYQLRSSTDNVHGSRVVAYVSNTDRDASTLIIPLHSCGRPIPVGAKYCEGCGGRL
jgi:hypothetical protein